MIHVIATIQTAPGGRDGFLTEFRKLVPLVRAEKGCIEYGAAIDMPTDIPVQAAAGDDHVFVIEKWESVEALKAHLAAAHMQEYRVRVREFVRGVTLQVLQPV
jgi:quinol monooxygenase YgiN